MHAPVVGFDLDLTLVDARPGIAACYRELAAETGVYVDVDAVLARIGPPLASELARWFPADQVQQAVSRYRELYAQRLTDCREMPGAGGALAAVRRHGGRIVVVTSKLARFARAHLTHLGIHVDVVIGDRFSDGKTAALVGQGVQLYVGDHVADVAAALAAGVTAVAVSTGPCGPDQLRAAGADAVLADLGEFPAWLDAHLDRQCGSGSS